MPKLIEYSKGEVLGDNGIAYLKDSGWYSNPDGTRDRKALFECHCGNEFESRILNIKRNRTASCGCSFVGCQKKKYVNGGIIGKNGITYIKELEPLITPSYRINPTRQGQGIRRALFQCHCGNYFETFIQNISKGQLSCGCQRCAWSRSSYVKFVNQLKESDSRVYVIILSNKIERFVKIGITSKIGNVRYKGIPYTYEVIDEYRGSPGFVFDKEKELHKLFSAYKYKPNIDFGGMTECFTLDVLEILKTNQYSLKI